MRLVLSTAFVAIQLIPLMGWLWRIDFMLDENRRHASPPRLTRSTLFDQGYYAELDRYIQDRFPLRGVLLRIRNWTDYRIFHTSPTPKVHVGRDGWLFLRSGLRGYRNGLDVNDPQVAGVFLKLHALERILWHAGIRLVFLVAPDKASIYPEFVGVDVPGDGMSAYEVFLQLEARHPIRGFLRLDDMLRLNKPDMLVYHKTDTHWSDQSSILVSRAILESLFAGEGMRYFPVVTLAERMRVHDLGRMIGLSVYESSMTDIGREYPVRVRSADEEGDHQARSEQSFRVEAGEGDVSLPYAVFYHDSFGQKLVPYLKSSFRRFDAYHWGHGIPMTTNEVEAPTPGVVIIEVVERNLEGIDIRLAEWVAALQGKLDHLADHKTALDVQRTARTNTIGLLPIRGSGEAAFRVLGFVAGCDNDGQVSVAMSVPGGAAVGWDFRLTEEQRRILLPIPFGEKVCVTVEADRCAMVERFEIMDLPWKNGERTVRVY